MGNLSKPNSSATEDIIIATAEQMFAENGIHGVALRAISQASGQGNSVAVQYHFKNRKGLVSAILKQRIQRIELRRRELLDALLESHLELRLEDYLEIIQQPLVELMDENKRHTFARFLLACYASADYWDINTGFGVRAWQNKSQRETNATMEILDLIAGCLPNLPEQVLVWRIMEYVRAIPSTIVAWENAQNSELKLAPLEVLLNDQLTMMAAALQAPLSFTSREFLKQSAVASKSTMANYSHSWPL